MLWQRLVSAPDPSVLSGGDPQRGKLGKADITELQSLDEGMRPRKNAMNFLLVANHWLEIYMSTKSDQ